jgi:hypothetical protein
MKFVCVFTDSTGREIFVPVTISDAEVKKAGAEGIAHALNRTFPKAPGCFWVGGIPAGAPN